jgi:two-component system cell cycle response regulator
VVAAAEDPALQAEPVALDRFPEVRAAFDTGLPVLVPDADTHPLYGPGRAVVGLDGHPAPLRSAIALPFSVDRGRHGVFLLRRTAGEPPFAEADLEFAEAAITAAVAVIQRAQVVEHARADNARLERLAQTDPLTQLLNRRALTERLQQEMERALRYDASLALLLVDLDHFKAVNDTHGHLVGDDALRDLARLLLDTVRTTDVVARYGGEEFLVLLPETDDTGAEGFAERIRQAVEAHRFEAAGAALRLTASLGVAVFPAPRVHTAEDLFVRADAALYRAKADGRNRVCT